MKVRLFCLFKCRIQFGSWKNKTLANDRFNQEKLLLWSRNPQCSTVTHYQRLFWILGLKWDGGWKFNGYWALVGVVRYTPRLMPNNLIVSAIEPWTDCWIQSNRLRPNIQSIPWRSLNFWFYNNCLFMHQLFWKFVQIVMKVFKRFCENFNSLTFADIKWWHYEKFFYFIPLKLNFHEYKMFYSTAV